MRHSNISLDVENSDYIFFNYQKGDLSNRSQIKKMKSIMMQAVRNELTDRQRECILLYYFDNLKMYQIADKLSLSPSTVTRHIKAGIKKLQNVAQYY